MRDEEMPPAVMIMPVVNGLAHTVRAIQDCLAQTVMPWVLVINQGADDEMRQRLEIWAEQEPRLLVWSHDPPLPSLSATWNTGLDWAWAIGATEAMVVNNDIRIQIGMYETLNAYRWGAQAYFVSGVGVREEQYDPNEIPTIDPKARGGPDFSCFLITREGHAKYRFDEGFVPAFCEDLDLHRRMMLGGDGAKIFGLNFPFAHLASGTLKTMDNEKAQAWQARVAAGSRAHYLRKWGGNVNEERFAVAFDADSVQDGIATPALQANEQAQPVDRLPARQPDSPEDQLSTVWARRAALEFAPEETPE